MTLPLTHQVALGGAGFSLAPQLDEIAAVETILAAAGAGTRIFDSARAYAPVGDPTHNERLLRNALVDFPDVLIATKGGHFRVEESRWEVDNSRARLRRDVDDSLRALGVDRLGLFYLHRADGSDSVDEAVRTLEDLRQAGKLTGIGLSNVTLEQLDEATLIAPVFAVQNPYSLLGGGDDAVLGRCQELGIPFFAYSPLGGSGGSLSLAAGLPRLGLVAATRGVSVQRLALAGLLARAAVMSVVVGAGRPATAVDAAAAAIERWDAAAQTALDADLAEFHAR